MIHIFDDYQYRIIQKWKYLHPYRIWELINNTCNHTCTCSWFTVLLMAATQGWYPLLAYGGTADVWSWSGNGSRTGNGGGKSMWAGEMSRLRVVAPHFIGDAVAALIALLPVPGVTGQVTTWLLFMELCEQKHRGCRSDNKHNIILSCMDDYREHIYLMHIQCMDAHLSGCILWQNQTGELPLPCTTARAHSSGISPTQKQWSN